MSRLDIKTASKAQTVVDRLYKDMERRIASSPPGLCPIDMSLTFLQLCHAQSCGKCVPCRIGLGQLSALMGQVLDGTGTMTTVDTIEKTARAIVASADCAIGRDAAQLVLSGFEGFRDDYVNHVKHHRCLASLQNPVPCVSLCPAGVDVPGYVALVREGRYADAVRLIRKDNPMPTACAYICEHPCEARCRRNMVDAPINIRGLKRYAVDHAGDVPNPPCEASTGKRVAIIGGGPSGLSCAAGAQKSAEAADDLPVADRLSAPSRSGAARSARLARAGTGKRFVERGRTHFRDRRAFQPVVVDGAPQRFKRHRAGLYRAAVGQPRVRSSAVSLGHRRGGAFSGAASEALSPAKKASGRSGNFARCVCLR